MTRKTIERDEFTDDEWEEFEPDRRSGRSRSLLLLVALALLVIFWPMWASFYTDLLWYDSLGYQTVFSTVLVTKITLAVAVGLITTLFVWLNLKLALRLSPERARDGNFFYINGERVQAPDFGKLIPRLALPASLVVGLFLGSIAWGEWEVFLRYQHQQPFADADPIFGRNIAYYFFTLPAFESLARMLLVLMVVGLVSAGAVYAARAEDFSINKKIRFSLAVHPRRHLLALAAGLFLILALQSYLAIPNLLYSTRGPVAGASYTDLEAVLPLLYAQIAACIIVAALAVCCIFMLRARLLWVGVGIYALTLAATWIYPSVVQRFSVGPNELAKETPNIERNIAATRKAFGLDDVQEREISGDRTLTANDIQENQLTVNNIRLWDQQQLLETFAQIQEIRTYYDFISVDNDRYPIGGQMRQVMLSPRELSSESLPNRNWINEHLTFTHGFGLTLGPVNEVTSEGLPVLFIKDIPPVSSSDVSSSESLRVERPEIYFGEISSDRVYVKTRTREFNYPQGEENVFASYEGEDGVSVGSKWRQLLFATRFADMKLLLSEDLTEESRVLYHRNIQERLGKVAPFLRFDSDPYLVIHEGRLFWIADAYTTSNRYPYSQPVSGGINYIRNSVKAVLDAYNGRVTLYVADPADPVIQTYGRIFPGILKPLEEMQEGLRAHLRYPEDMFRIQASVYTTYHMDQAQVFYNKEDEWAVAAMSEGQNNVPAQVMEPYYTIMKLPGETEEEFILMLPFTPRRKDNLAAWMAARADGEHYGKLVVYRFPKQKLIFGPKQIVARINQEPEISRQLSLWNQRGSQVILGTLMVIPVEESLVYVQPLYLRADSGKIPELRRVIVAVDNRIAMEPTLNESLSRIFGSQPPVREEAPLAQSPTPSTPTETAPPAATDVQGLAAQARQHYERAVQAQREGDWARYGEEIKRLGAVLEQMTRQR